MATNMISLNQNKVAEIQRQLFKQNRQAQVDAITVEVQGMVFQGDEVSQTRMARAITALQPEETILWVLADNTPVQATREQLVEALRLSGQAQAAIWVQQ